MKKRYLIQFILIIICSLLYFWANIQRVSVPGAIFDVLQSDLKTNASGITALGASFMYIYALGQLVIGILIARYGGYKVINTGAIIFAIGSLLFPFSNSLWLLYISRALVGLGCATFYLGIIEEIKKIVSKNNFGIVLSVILFVGYMGGIIANAPLFYCVSKIGWRYTYAFFAVIIAILTLLFVIFNFFVPKQETDKSVNFDLSFFKNILSKKENIYLYIFGCTNYAIYYSLQTIIGKKFLEDFCKIPSMKAAVILSLMGGLYAVSGYVLATLCKAILNRRTLILRITAVNTFVSVGIIVFCLIFDIKTSFIAVLFAFIAFLASQSPIIIPLLQDINEPKEAPTSISIMTAGFYIMVAALSNIMGIILNKSAHIISQSGAIVYSEKAYTDIFILLFVFAAFSVFTAFKIKESKKTLRFLQMCSYLEEKYGDNKHDKYEHNMYSNI